MWAGELLDLEQQAAQGRAELGRAQLKADVPAEVQQRIELEKALLDKRGRERDLQNLEAARSPAWPTRNGASTACSSTRR